MLDDVVFLDLETTGGSLAHDRIIEIGLVEVRGGRLAEEWSTLVNPGRRIPQVIQSLTGITDEMVASAPAFESVSAVLAERLQGKVLAAHNARFDYGFLRSEFQRTGMRYSAPVLCTVKLSRRLFPQHRRHNLDALIMRHALYCLDRHRGLGDARALWELAQIWRRDLGAEALASACAELLRTPAVPAGLPADLFDTLPEGPGVYVFYGERNGDRNGKKDGEKDAVLYVGRSINIRARVLAHFSADHPAGKDAHITREVRRIECLETAGALGACLQEARLLRQLSPAHNRSHADGELCAWQWLPEKPDMPPQLVDVGGVDAAELGRLYGLFRTRASALSALRGLAKAYALCRGVLGLERGHESGPCSEYRAGRCRGACVGAESALSHAMRLAQALAGLRLRTWPYPGRIGVREHDRESERTELHVLDRWRYLGTVHSEAELHELAEGSGDGVVDLDIYKILARFLKAPPRTCDIVQLDGHARYRSRVTGGSA